MTTQTNQFRIIAGQWRGRRFALPADANVRPTPDRVRETVFNWLMQDIQGANCLDAFAGSGALGLEALSRGAKSVTFIDQSKIAIASLQAHLTKLNCHSAQVLQANCLKVLSTLAQPFNILFLDPPFRQDIVPSLMVLLRQYRCWQLGTLIYLETENTFALNNIINDNKLLLLRSKTAGQVAYHLLKVISL